MHLGLNNILALQGNTSGQGLGNVSLASSLFGSGNGLSGGLNAFGIMLNQDQSGALTLAQNMGTTNSVVLDPQLNIQVNSNAKDIAAYQNQAGLGKVFPNGGDILRVSEEANAPDTTNQPNTEALPEEPFMLSGVVSLNKEGQLEIVDENGVVIDAEFLKLLEQNPEIKQFLTEKLQSGEKISLGEDVLQALVSKTKDLSSQISVKNNTLVLNASFTTEVAAQNIKTSNEWAAGQKAENSIITPVAQDAKVAQTPNTNTQPTPQAVQGQPSSKQEGFSMDMNADGGSDFSQNFGGDGIDSIDGDWAQAQTHRNNTVQNFGTHLAQAKSSAQAYVPVAEQVSMQIQKGLQGQLDKISLQLDPADLGKVTIDFDFSDDHHGRVLISAEKSETLDMLRQDARTLQKILSDAGMDAGKNSLEFSLGHNQNQHQDADKTKKINDMKFDISGIENLGTEIESIVIPSSGVIAVGKVNIVV